MCNKKANECFCKCTMLLNAPRSRLERSIRIKTKIYFQTNCQFYTFKHNLKLFLNAQKFQQIKETTLYGDIKTRSRKAVRNNKNLEYQSKSFLSDSKKWSHTGKKRRHVFFFAGLKQFARKGVNMSPL